MKIDIFKYTEKIPSDLIRRKVLDNVFNMAIPFNLSLGLRLRSVSPDIVEVTSATGWKTRNHVGGAHACFLALIGEYPAGILLAQNYSPEDYRMIIGELKVEYHKQVRGRVKGVARKPDNIPELGDEEIWIPMVTEIFDSKGNLAATARTNWQLKRWSAVRKKSDSEEKGKTPSQTV